QSRREDYLKIQPALEESFRGVDTVSAARAEVLYVFGDREEAKANLKKAVEVWKEKKTGAADIATVYMRMGDLDEAFRWLEVAYSERSWGIVSLAVDPYWDPLRGDPRLPDLLRRIGLPTHGLQPS
ncbi:MAG TPA: tetratricopeptide repeat protein, partial [Nitrososphaerales archaeon]|nr:tetratricopeptide repeat protein [Nitrososphaerales archaeon]